MMHRHRVNYRVIRLKYYRSATVGHSSRDTTQSNAGGGVRETNRSPLRHTAARWTVRSSRARACTRPPRLEHPVLLATRAAGPYSPLDAAASGGDWMLLRSVAHEQGFISVLRGYVRSRRGDA